MCHRLHKRCFAAMQITHAILVEVEGAQVQHAETVALVLSKIAPGVKLVVLQATANTPSRGSDGTSVGHVGTEGPRAIIC